MLTLDELNDAAETPLGFALASLPCRDIHNGFYTLSFPFGDHRTFRLYTQQHGVMAGKRILGMLIGPDNSKDYEDFAFLEDGGFKVWKRFKNARQAEYLGLLWKIMRGEVLEGYELTESRRCLKCNRMLSDPVSNELGIGPKCRGDM